jgi:hypothetical protein
VAFIGFKFEQADLAISYYHTEIWTMPWHCVFEALHVHVPDRNVPASNAVKRVPQEA